jgi:molybdate transport repressor ModE-like protein
MDRIADLTLFLRVLDLGSISAAARNLGISVAVASQRLKRLEQALGVRLLARTTRRLHATAEGAALAERGRPLIEDLEVLTADLRHSASDASGTLRVTLPASFGRQYISPLLPEFLERHPRVRLNVSLTDQMVDLVSTGVDLAVRIGRLRDSALVARQLATNRRMLCASPEYLRRRGLPRSPEDLARHDCLLLAGAQGSSDAWTLTDPSGNDIRVHVRGPLESSMGEVLRDAAIAGLGISMHSAWHVCDDLRAGRLRVVLPRFPVPATGIYALMPQRRLTPPRVRAFVEFLAERFGGKKPPWERARQSPAARSLKP